MDLRKFKQISVIMLAAAVLFLAVIMITNKNKTENLPHSVAENMSVLFEKAGISLSAGTVPLAREELDVYSMSGATPKKAEEIAALISDSTRRAANLMEDGYIFRLQSGAFAFVSPTRAFEYSSRNNAGAGEVDFNIGAFVSASTLSAASQNNAKLIINKLMNNDGNVGTYCTYRLVSGLEESDTQLHFDIYIGDTQVRNTKLNISADGEKILSAEGYAFFDALKKENGKPKYDIINVLKAEYDRLLHEGSTANTVTSIKPCYISELGEDDTVYFLPGWTIFYDNGDVSVYNSITCQIVRD